MTTRLRTRDKCTHIPVAVVPIANETRKHSLIVRHTHLPVQIYIYIYRYMHTCAALCTTPWHNDTRWATPFVRGNQPPCVVHMPALAGNLYEHAVRTRGHWIIQVASAATRVHSHTYCDHGGGVNMHCTLWILCAVCAFEFVCVFAAFGSITLSIIRVEQMRLGSFGWCLALTYILAQHSMYIADGVGFG